MQPTNNHRGLIILAIMVAIVGYIVGLGIINIISKKPSGKEPGQQQIKTASDLKTQAGSLAKTNGDLTVAVTTSAIDTPQDFDKQSKELAKNTEILGNTIGDAYGQNAKTTFAKMWESHLVSLINYAVAVKNNDTKTAQKSTSDLTQFEDNFAGFLNSLNPQLSKAAVSRKVKEYIDPLQASIDAHVKGDATLASAKQTEASQASQVLFNIITSSITKQFPDKYK